MLLLSWLGQNPLPTTRGARGVCNETGKRLVGYSVSTYINRFSKAFHLPVVGTNTRYVCILSPHGLYEDSLVNRSYEHKPLPSTANSRREDYLESTAPIVFSTLSFTSGQFVAECPQETSSNQPPRAVPVA
jgi:hypothetical protein